MIRLAADEDVSWTVLNGVLRLEPTIDIVRAQRSGLAGRSDPEVLAWAAVEGRVLITHDVSTMEVEAYARVAAGLPMSGVLIIPQRYSTAAAIDHIWCAAVLTEPVEWIDRISHAPL